MNCKHDEYRVIEHPDGGGGEVPYCPACDELLEL